MMLCAFASWRLGVKCLCRPDGAEINFGLGFYKYAAPTALGTARRRKRQPGRARSPAKSQPGGQWQFGLDERGKGRLNTLHKGGEK